MKRIRCGVIGLGWFGEHHVDTLQQLPLVEVAAVCTRTESRLKEMAGKVRRAQGLHRLPASCSPTRASTW